MAQLSAIVITKNEAANIGACLDSLAFCDERIVVDCGSADATVQLAKKRAPASRFRNGAVLARRRIMRFRLLPAHGC